MRLAVFLFDHVSVSDLLDIVIVPAADDCGGSIAPAGGAGVECPPIFRTRRVFCSIAMNRQTAKPRDSPNKFYSIIAEGD